MIFKEHRLAQSGCLDRADSAKYLSISIRLLDTLVARGDLSRVKIGRKTLFRIPDLDQFIESRIERSEVKR